MWQIVFFLVQEEDRDAIEGLYVRITAFTEDTFIGHLIIASSSPYIVVGHYDPSRQEGELVLHSLN